MAFSVVAVVALPPLLPQSKPPPERDKSPGPPKLAITNYLARVISLVRPPTKSFARLEHKKQQLTKHTQIQLLDDIDEF